MNTVTDYHPQAVQYAHAGLLAIQVGHYTKSRMLLTRAVQLEPRLGEAWRWLAALQTGARQAICLQHAQSYVPGATIPRLPEPAWLPPEKIIESAADLEYKPQLRWQSVGLAATGVLAASILALGGFEIAYADKVYPGVNAFGISLSGLDHAEATQQLAPILSVWQQRTATIIVGDQQWTLPLNQVADFSPAAISTQAYTYGRTGSWQTRLADQSDVLLNPTSLAMPTLQSATLAQFFDQVAAQIEQPAQAASFIQDTNGQWSVEPALTGVAFDREHAWQTFTHAWQAQNWQRLPQDLTFELPVQALQPQVSTAELANHLPQLNRQTSIPLNIKLGEQKQELDRASFLNLEQLPSDGQAFKPNIKAIQAYLADLGSTYNQPAMPSMLQREGAYAREWRIAQQGREIDTQAATLLLSRALEQPQQAALEIPITVTQPPAGDLEVLGITDVIGVGKSQFASYSSPNRDANVIVGGSEFDGLLIAPGEIVSFNTTVGEITAAKGYQMGEMISGGMVVPSYGGGICQVSTTFFRAAFWAGLPIEERHNHAWRLDWYETDAPVGMDATIALGGPDLKIRNSTKGHILIDVQTDLEHKTQTFTLYGTPQDIDVALVGPDWSRGGVVITRQISQANTVVQEDHWISYYSQ